MSLGLFLNSGEGFFGEHTCKVEHTVRNDGFGVDQAAESCRLEERLEELLERVLSFAIHIVFFCATYGGREDELLAVELVAS